MINDFDGNELYTNPGETYADSHNILGNLVFRKLRREVEVLSFQSYIVAIINLPADK